MNRFGKSLLAGLVAGALGALLGFGLGKLFVHGDDPERIALSVMLICAFLSGTITCGIAAARLDPARPFGTAILASLAFEAILLVVARPGLNPRAVGIAFAVAAFFAAIAAVIGLPRKPSP
jgi:hypothetical protein